MSVLSVNLIKCNASGKLVCDGGCAFCIAKQTPFPSPYDNSEIVLNFHRALKFMSVKNIDTIMFTGKTEPTLCSELVPLIVMAKEYGIPNIELQTNGLNLWKNPVLREQLIRAGVTTISISINSTDPNENNHRFGWEIGNVKQMYDYSELLEMLYDKVGTRVCLNYYWPIHTPEEEYEILHNLHVNQITVRKLGKIQMSEDIMTLEQKNVVSAVDYRNDENTLNGYTALFNTVKSYGAVPIRHLYYGPTVYYTPFNRTVLEIGGSDTNRRKFIGGHSWIFTDCMEHEAKEEDEVRQYILWNNGRIGTKWDYLDYIS